MDTGRIADVVDDPLAAVLVDVGHHDLRSTVGEQPSTGLQLLDSVEVPQTILMAGSVIISLPVILLFFLAERFLTDGLTQGGVKG